MPASERTPRVVVQPFALVERNGKQVAYIVKEGKAVETPVVTGAKIGELFEVKSGIKTGDRVVARPPEKMRDGAAVTVQAK
jgi:multidrug efflux pump subunit AcrA (membrane-fusion protein)